MTKLIIILFVLSSPIWARKNPDLQPLPLRAPGTTGTVDLDTGLPSMLLIQYWSGATYSLSLTNQFERSLSSDQRKLQEMIQQQSKAVLDVGEDMKKFCTDGGGEYLIGDKGPKCKKKKKDKP